MAFSVVDLPPEDVLDEESLRPEENLPGSSFMLFPRHISNEITTSVFPDATAASNGRRPSKSSTFKALVDAVGASSKNVSTNDVRPCSHAT